MLHVVMVSLVGVNCSEANLLTATIVVGSILLVYYLKVPVIDWIRLAPFLSNMGSEFSGRAYFTVCPYVGGIVACGAYCGFLGAVCWNLVKALAIYPGIDVSTYCWA